MLHHLAAALVRKLRNAERLDRQHREHARHQVENQPAEQRQKHGLEQTDPGDAAGWLRRLEPGARHLGDGGTRRRARDAQVHLDEARLAVRSPQRQDSAQTLVRAGIVVFCVATQRDQKAVRVERVRAAARHLELQVFDSIRHEGLQRIARTARVRPALRAEIVDAGEHGHRAAERIARPDCALRPDRLHLQPQLAGGDRNARRPASEQRAGLWLGGLAPLGHSHHSCQLDLARNAAHLADQEVGRHGERLLAPYSRLERDLVREQQLVRVAVGRELPRLAEHGGGRPEDRTDARGLDRPVEPRRQPRLPGIAPVDVPAAVELEVHGGAERLAGRGDGNVREESCPNPRVSLVRRAGCRGRCGGSGGGRAAAAEDEDNGERAEPRGRGMNSGHWGQV